MFITGEFTFWRHLQFENTKQALMSSKVSKILLIWWLVEHQVSLPSSKEKGLSIELEEFSLHD